MYLAPKIYLIQKGKKWLNPIYFSETKADKAAKAAGLDPSVAVRGYPGVFGRFPLPMHPAWLAEMLKRGCIVPKSNLQDGAWYIGQCRNANLAQWDAKRGVFVHWREKFKNLFPETIKHPEDDNGFDLFWPAEKVYPILRCDDLRGRTWDDGRGWRIFSPQ